METEYLLDTIDTHTAGEPTRILVGGVDLGGVGDPVDERMARFEREHDDVRKLLMQEPRGHDDMFGAVPVAPAEETADLGLFFLVHDGYGEMCGHAIIGVVTAFVETGRLSEGPVVIETPVGSVRAHPHVADGRVEAVTVENTPSFVYDRLTVDPSRVGPVAVDVVYSGIFFAMVDVAEVDASLDRKSVDVLSRYGVAIREAVNDRLDVTHPLTGRDSRVLDTAFYEPRGSVDRILTVLSDGSVDRSPCGTGTCGRMTLLYDRGELALDQPHRTESVIGTEFEGRLTGVDRRDGLTVVTPEVTGSAYVVAKNTYLLDPDDPLTGFSVGDSSTDGQNDFRSSNTGRN